MEPRSGKELSTASTSTSQPAPSRAQLETQARAGDNAAALTLGRQALKNSNFDEAIQWFRPGADRKDPACTYALAEVYEKCYDRTKDKQLEQEYLLEALQWAKRAADLGHVEALVLQGSILEPLDPADAAEAYQLYQRAADRGSNEGLYLLARAHVLGRGVPRDFPTAVTFAQKAADRGDVSAMSLIARLANGPLGGDPKYVRLGEKYAQKAIDAGDRDLGNVLAELKLKLGDEKGAIPRLVELAHQGKTDVFVKLGKIYYEGSSLPHDDQKAAEWFRKAANDHQTDGMYYLGLLYRDGRGVPKDPKLCLEWMSTAALLGHGRARWDVAQIYKEGRLVPQDMDLYRSYLQDAEQVGYPEAVRYLKAHPEDRPRPRNALVIPDKTPEK